MDRVRITTNGASSPQLGIDARVTMADGKPLPLAITDIQISFPIDGMVTATLTAINVDADVEASAVVVVDCPCCKERIKLLLSDIAK